MAQHPPGGLRDRWPGPDPGEGAHLDPLGVEGCRIRPELGQQLLLLAVEPALTTGLLLGFVIHASLFGIDGRTVIRGAALQKPGPQ